MQRGLIACLLGLSLAVRALVPSGWMPANGGFLSIMPCPAASAMPADHHMAGHHAPSSADQHSDCAFSPLHAAAAPAHAAAVVLAPVSSNASATEARSPSALSRAPPALPPPATGPPLTA